MRLVGLETFASAYPHHLSGGMAQRVALARALINHPKILLLDEPLGALDAFTRMRLQDEVLRLWQARRTTMMLVTHDIDEAIYMSGRIAIMSPGPGKIERSLQIPFPYPRERTALISACGHSPRAPAFRRMGFGAADAQTTQIYAREIVCTCRAEGAEIRGQSEGRKEVRQSKSESARFVATGTGFPPFVP
jgi:ABC-type sulfate/molybdate transport systems ATPase subunit